MQRRIDVALIERHLVEEIALHRRTGCRRLSFQQRSLARHFDRLAKFSDLQLRIDFLGCVGS